MKKYNLLKVLAITILACWLLTLIIPGSVEAVEGALIVNGKRVQLVSERDPLKYLQTMGISISSINIRGMQSLEREKI